VKVDGTLLLLLLLLLLRVYVVYKTSETESWLSEGGENMLVGYTCNPFRGAICYLCKGMIPFWRAEGWGTSDKENGISHGILVFIFAKRNLALMS
jgi:hypothetical protein